MKSKLAGKKILFACVPADGHFNPLTGLAKYLQEEGCDVRWYSSGIYEGKLKKLGIHYYPFVVALDINGSNLQQLLPGLKTDNALEKSTLYQKHFFAGRAVEYYEDIRQIHESFPFDLMISDSTYSAIPFIRHYMNIPVVTIGIIPLAEDSVDTAPYRSGLPPAENDVMRAEYAGLYAKNLEVFKKPISIFTSILEEHHIPFKPSTLTDILIRSTDLYLQIGSTSFEYKRSDLSSNVRFIGALMPYSVKSDRQPWFDERLTKYKKVILVTQGTIEADVTKLLEPTLKAFEHTDILVIATTAGNRTEELSAKFTAPNLIIADYIPFDEVMPYADVFVTNGGYTAAILSIRNKLPMVAAGLHELKNEVCARIGYFKYGINLETEKPSPEAIYNAVIEIMKNKIYKNNVTNLCNEFATYNSNELCAGYILELLEKYKHAAV
jgi:UDP:flavonoid glycosyltransferase YjiC (YdhE family)